ncbi:phage head morphogenesis protein [Enterococcus faecalis]|nr:phage head morphogenesis protein [Enterococcus faecalis]NSV17397.1 minor capsid protein [Enterococcus faecalis]NSV22782.1 minor capsid protein [Enterococcus faecalis]NSV30839.1 minor capsid protein [Enterococcus faecalis]NSV40696.1 minor capsid protein [Enterococcus faecalis]
MSYLKNREESWIKEQMKLDRNREKEIVQQLQNAIDAIQTEIEANWDRFSNGQKITISEARKMANKMDVKRFERKAKEYVKNKDFSPQANKELKIYNLVMRVSRLELLKSQIGLELITLFDELDKWGYSQLTEAAKDEYLRQAGILGETVKENYSSKVRKIVNASFKSSDFPSFSDNIWQNFVEMKADLEKIITQAITQGKNPRAVAKEMAKFLNPNQLNIRYKLNRLMMTETSGIQTDIQKQSYLDADIEEYDYIAEPFACEICKKVAKGSPYRVLKMKKGINAPYMHPHCKCSTVPKVSEDYEKSLKERGL